MYHPRATHSLARALTRTPHSPPLTKLRSVRAGALLTMPEQFAHLFNNSASTEPTPPPGSFQTMLQQALALTEADVRVVVVTRARLYPKIQRCVLGLFIAERANIDAHTPGRPRVSYKGHGAAPSE